MKKVLVKDFGETTEYHLDKEVLFKIYNGVLGYKEYYLITKSKKFYGDNVKLSPVDICADNRKGQYLLSINILSSRQPFNKQTNQKTNILLQYEWRLFFKENVTFINSDGQKVFSLEVKNIPFLSPPELFYEGDINSSPLELFAALLGLFIKDNSGNNP